jgi:hypothetical protein
MAMTTRNRGRSRRRLGEVLLEEGVVNADQLQAAYDDQRRTGDLLVDTLLRMGAVSEDALTQIIIKHQNLPFIPIERYYITEEQTQIFPAELLYQYGFMPLDRLGSVLVVVAGTVLDNNAISELERICGCRVQVYVGRPSEVWQQIETHFPDAPPRPKPVAVQLSSLGGMLLDQEDTHHTPRKPIRDPVSATKARPEPEAAPTEERDEDDDSGMSSLGSMLLGDDL